MLARLARGDWAKGAKDVRSWQLLPAGAVCRFGVKRSYLRKRRVSKLLGFTIVELLVVAAVIGVLVAMLLPAVQAAREAARRSQCSSQLRQVAQSILQYEAARGHLPPGSLGPRPHRSAFRFKRLTNRDDQFLGLIPFVLPYLGESAIYDLIEPDMLEIDADPFRQNWVRNTDTLQAAHPTLSLLNCPSGPEPTEAEAQLLLINIYFNWQTEKFLLEGAIASLGLMQGSADTVVPAFGSTNYAGSMGFFGNLDDDKAQRYLGPIYSRSKTRMGEIVDGTSHTLLVGETTGHLEQGALKYSHSWMGCGTLPLGLYFGEEPGWQSFGTFHHGGIPFATADNALRFVDPEIDTDLLLALGGMHDSELAPAE